MIALIICCLISIGFMTYFIEDKEFVLYIYTIWIIVVFVTSLLFLESYKEEIEQGQYKIDSVGYRYDSQTKDTIILYKLNKR